MMHYAHKKVLRSSYVRERQESVSGKLTPMTISLQIRFTGQPILIQPESAFACFYPEAHTKSAKYVFENIPIVGNSNYPDSSLRMFWRSSAYIWKPIAEKCIST